MQTNLKISNIQYNKTLKLDPGLMKQIENTVKWNETPKSFCAGRSGHIKLSAPIEMYGHDIRGLKLKGIGHFEEVGKGNPPSVDAYEDAVPIWHQGATAEGKFEMIWQRPRPDGGMFASGAEQEYLINLDMIEAEAEVNVPICWGSFEDLKFQGSDLGFVVFGLLNQFDDRLDALITEDINTNPYLKGILTYNDPKGIIKFFSDLYYSFGQAHRMHFHDRNWLRFAAHSGNLFFYPELGKLGMCDFDSCVSRDVIEHEKIFFSLLFDVLGVLRGLHEIICQSAFGRLIFIKNCDQLYYHFLRGYFSEISNAAGKKPKKKKIRTNPLIAIKEGLARKTRENLSIIDREVKKMPIEADFPPAIKNNLEQVFRNGLFYYQRTEFSLFAIKLLFPLMVRVYSPIGIKAPYGEKQLSHELEAFEVEIKKVMEQEKEKTTRADVKKMLNATIP